MRLILPKLKPINRCPKLSSKTNKMTKKKMAYETSCTGFVRSIVRSKLKKLLTDKIAGNKRRRFRCFTLPLYIKNKEQGR